jgi:hypothetical protein
MSCDFEGEFRAEAIQALNGSLQVRISIYQIPRIFGSAKLISRITSRVEFVEGSDLMVFLAKGFHEFALLGSPENFLRMASACRRRA